MAFLGRFSHAVVIVAVTAWARPIAAQCPDGSPPPCRPRVVHLSDSLIAILPFRTVGPSLDVFGEGLVYLLSFNLDGAGGLTTVLPQRAIERAAGQRTGDPAVLAALARDLGAATAVNGSLVSTGAGGVRLIVNAIEARSARNRSDVSFALDGAESSIGSLADSASLILLSRLTRVPLPRVAIGKRLPRSIDALRAFLAGERAVRAARYDEADSLFDKALDYDSTFALAYYRRFVLRRSQAVVRPPDQQTLVRRALALSDRLPERERRLLHASRRGGAYLDSTDFEERLDFVVRYPDDAEGWWWLEDWYAHAGAIYGYPLRRVVEAGERAIENRSNLWIVYGHALWAAGRAGDSAAVERLLSATERFSGHPEPNFRAAYRLRSAAPDSARRLVSTLRGLPVDSLMDVAVQLSLMDSRIEALGLVEEVLRLAHRAATRRAQLTLILRLRAELLAGQGQFEAARAVLDSARQQDSLNAGVVHTGALLALAGLAPSRAADTAIAGALRSLAARKGMGGIWSVDLLVRLRLGDSSAAAERARVLATHLVETEVDSGLVALDSLAIFARLALSRGDTTTAVRLLEPITRVATGSVPFLWVRFDALDQYLLGALYASRGERARARAVLDRLDGGHASGGGVLGLKLLLLADLDAAAGDTVAARRHYADVVALWRDGDSVVQPYVQRARTALARLEGR